MIWAMMAGVVTTCEECGGQRFQASVLGYTLGARNIAEVFAMSATEAKAQVLADIDERSSLMCHPSWGRARTAAQRLSDLARLRRVRDRIDREYAQPLDVEALARGVNMSAGHLSRQFRLAYDESPSAYLRTRRIERAMALLRRGDLSVTDVCFVVGCSSLGTFSTRFTELVGMSPKIGRAHV